MIPRSVEDLKRRNRGLARIAEATVGLMGRTPDYMNVKFAGFAARHATGRARTAQRAGRRATSSRFQKRLARDDVSLTHTIIQPTIDKATERRSWATRCRVHKVGDTGRASWCAAPGSWRRWRRSPTRSRSIRRIRCRPGAEAYALAFAIPVDTPGLMFLCRDSAARPARISSTGRSRPASTSRTPS